MPDQYISLICQHCGRSFHLRTWEARRPGRGKFCSRACGNRANMPRRIAAIAGRPAHNRKEPIPKACEMCGAVFTVQHSAAHQRFCSTACVHAYKRTIRGANHPLDTRIERACEMCGKVVRVKAVHQERFRFCSRRCTGAWVSNNHPRTSSIERMLREELTRRGIPFLAEKAMANFTVDLAFPAARLVVEADGDYWHGRPAQQERDSRKDSWLTSHGWRVLRLWEREIRADVVECVDRIVVLIDATRHKRVS